jgi:hypothetical protein
MSCNWLGLLDTGGANKNVWKEIVESMGMVKDGIDAVLVVFSAASRFSEEDAKTIKSLQRSFGERMIWTFTHRDEVGKDEFEEMLKDAPEYMLVRFTFHGLLLLSISPGEHTVHTHAQCSLNHF